MTYFYSIIKYFSKQVCTYFLLLISNVPSLFNPSTNFNAHRRSIIDTAARYCGTQIQLGASHTDILNITKNVLLLSWNKDEFLALPNWI